MTGLAVLFNAVTAGTPLGIALALAAGIGWNELVGTDPDPDEHGHVLCDRVAIGAWESFLLSHDGDSSGLLSHVGLFSARGGGGGPVYANRVNAGEWERWTVVENGDDTVSLRTFNGPFSAQ